MSKSSRVEPIVDLRCMVGSKGDCHLTLDLTLAANRLGNSQELVHRWEKDINAFLETQTLSTADVRQYRQDTSDGVRSYIACIGLTPESAQQLGQKLDELYARDIHVGTTNFAEQIGTQLNKPHLPMRAQITQLGTVGTFTERAVREKPTVAFQHAETVMGNSGHKEKFPNLAGSLALSA